MKRLSPLAWPLLVGALALGVTAWLWSHERQTAERHLRDNFDFGVRQAVTRVEQRMASYEQMLRGTRGLFEATGPVGRAAFSAYVDTLLGGADFVGLRAIAYAPLLDAAQVEAHVAAQRAGGVPAYAVRPAGTRAQSAPVTYSAPVTPLTQNALGYDPLSDPVRREAMLQARDSGSIAITDRIQPVNAIGPNPEPSILMYLPLYAVGRPTGDVAARRAALSGWVFVAFRVEDMMSSLYGEATPGLDLRIYDGVRLDDAALMYPSGGGAAPAATAAPARFEAQEYLGFAGHTWTLVLRSRPEFEQRFSSDSARIIAVAGTGLSLLLALLAWQLVTRRERAHAAAQAMTRELRESTQRYRRIVETANEGIWAVDAEGRTSFVNPKLTQMLGWSAAQMLDRPWGEFMDERSRAALAGPGASGLQRGPAERHDVCFRRRDGSELWATLSTSPIDDGAGGHAGVLAMVTDVTERKLAEARRSLLEAQLRQSQKMEAIGTLAGGIAHDFNNILAAILGNVALVQQELGAGHGAAARLEQIGRAGTRARSLVQQIVAFSRQQPQALVVQPLRPLLEETVKLLRSTLPALVELELRLSDAPLHIEADATQLQQVLMNLCTNAWHALQGRTGRIVVGLDAVDLDAEAADRLGAVAAGRHAHVWVSDDGCGMDEATRARVFEPFFTTKPVGQGTGLGLAVAHGIVSSHRGAIAVTSRLGEGSSFELYFPLATPVTAAPRAAPLAAPAGRGERLLYVDDDPVMVLMVEGLLQRLGYRVSCTSDPREALERVRAEPAAFDAVITDFNMPELSGLDLAQALRLLRPDLPVVISSGYLSETLRHQAQQAGVTHLLQKEYTLEQLGGLLHEVLRERCPTRVAG